MSLADRIRAGEVDPWVGNGADGCRRSAAVERDELATLAADDPRRDELAARAEAWLDRAAVLEEAS